MDKFFCGNDQIEKKYEHECRKYKPAYSKLKATIEDKNISSKDYFIACYKYDLLHSFQAVGATSLGFTNGTQFCGFFIRKFLEAYAVLFAEKEQQFEETNYKLFKIMSQKREIGKKESDKLKSQFKIKSSKNLQELYEENPYMFLLGATENQTTPFELLRGIETNDKLEEQEKDSILENYRLTSCLIHYIYEYDLGPEIFQNINKIFKAEEKAVKKYLRKDLQNNGKLGDPTDINSSFLEKSHELETSLIGTSLVMLQDFQTRKVPSVLIPPFAYFVNTILTLDFWFARKEYSYIMCVPKMFFEKAHLYFHLAEIESYVEMETKALSYKYLVEHKVSLSHEELCDDQEIDENIHKIFNAYKNTCGLKSNYYDFKKRITDQPAYLIYTKERNFTNLALIFANLMEDSYDKNELISLYKESVDYSHSLGRMIFVEEEDYLEKAVKISSIVLDTLLKYINIIKNHPIIKLDEHSFDDLNSLNVLENIINEIKELYLNFLK